MMIVAGTVNYKQAVILERMYEQMAEPKWVISMGVCASSGGFYDNYAVVQGIDEIIPVDVYIGGCPPAPRGRPGCGHEVAGQDRDRAPPRTPARLDPRAIPSSASCWPSVIRRPPLEATIPFVTAKLQQLFGLPACSPPTSSVATRPSSSSWRRRDPRRCAPCATIPSLAFNFLMDFTITDYLTFPQNRPVVDYLGAEGARFEVVYHFYSLTKGHRLRLKAPVAHGETVATATELYASANWMEREAWEMYGVTFLGHQNLKRLLTHKDFVGYPLRKDFPLKKRRPTSESDSMMDEMEARLRFKGLK